MSRRLMIRLAVALGGLVVLAFGSLAVLIAATSAPVLPPPPLPTATAQPGPNSPSLVTPLPGTDPNSALHTLMGGDQSNAALVTALTYRDTTRPGVLNPPCGLHGRWTLQINPESVVGHPYSRPPGAPEWNRAAEVIATATSLCSTPVTVAWFAHDKARPSSDRWLAILSPTVAAGIDGPTLRAYALSHARQL